MIHRTNTFKVTWIMVMLAAILLTASCGGNRSRNETPQPVLSGFEASFGKVKKTQWELTIQHEYRASFIRDGHPSEAYFDPQGILLKTQTELLSSELPSVIVSTVNGAFRGSSIAKAFQIDEPGKDMIFRLHLKTGRKVSYVDLNADGVIMINTIR